MRLWSIHPSLLDGAGFRACWRESLLAQAALTVPGHGYRHHPQLERWRDAPHALSEYLWGLYRDALRRGYNMDWRKIRHSPDEIDAADFGDAPHVVNRLFVSRGQLIWEWEHLLAKCYRRDRRHWSRIRRTRTVAPHPVFWMGEGDRASWERGPVRMRRCRRAVSE